MWRSAASLTDAVASKDMDRPPGSDHRRSPNWTATLLVAAVERVHTRTVVLPYPRSGDKRLSISIIAKIEGSACNGHCHPG